jgi:hypothetical protein
MGNQQKPRKKFDRLEFMIHPRLSKADCYFEHLQ